jgi:CubicO group peptidase (beta-lactamase class C family)
VPLSRLPEVDSLVRRAIDARQIAGAMTLITQHGQVIHESAIGMIDIEAGKSMQPDAIFRIASMTKPITAVAVLMLVDEGQFGLDDPIAAFIPEFHEAAVYVGSEKLGPQLTTRHRDITVRDLLTHTSGMALGNGGEEPIEVLWTDAVAELMGTPGTTLQSAVQVLATLPLANQPGMAWRYGLSFEALAALVEVVSGLWYDQFLRQRIFEPLGMVDTGYIIQPEHAHRLAALYRTKADDVLELAESPQESAHVQMFDYESGSGWTTGGDMLVSTAADYSRFLEMLRNGGELDGRRLLRPETVTQMVKSQVADVVLRRGSFAQGYGQGLAVHVLQHRTFAGDVGTAGEVSGGGGHGTYYWFDPAQDLVGVLMVQIDAASFDLQRQVRATVYRSLRANQ